MARNFSFLPEHGEGGHIDLTLLSPLEYLRNRDEEDPQPRMALLTVRGRDNELTAVELEKLGRACFRYARLIRDGR